MTSTLLGSLLDQLASVMHRAAAQGRPFKHTVWECAEGNQLGYLIYRAKHGKVTTPVVAFVDEPEEGKYYVSLTYLTEEDRVTCESVQIKDLKGLQVLQALESKFVTALRF